MKVQSALLPCGKRLHLQHGPIDLVVGADGDRKGAFAAASKRFETVLEELVAELSDLKQPLAPETPKPLGQIAGRMDKATRPFATANYITRMAAVAGAVADTILEAMTKTSISRGYVNNGGDIALHLEADQTFSLAVSDHGGCDLGRVVIRHNDPIRGIATSGRHGRSFSLGIADSVTVLAANAACADVVATLVANSVDLPNHPAITRSPARELDEASDLGELPVVTGCELLSGLDKEHALALGRAKAEAFIRQGLIFGAALFLQDQAETTRLPQLSLAQRIPENA